MFWTAFVWGLGVSCGASLGVFVLILMKSGLNRIETLLGWHTVNLVNQKMIALLTERNVLTGEIAKEMAKLVVALELSKTGNAANKGREQDPGEE